MRSCLLRPPCSRGNTLRKISPPSIRCPSSRFMWLKSTGFMLSSTSNLTSCNVYLIEPAFFCRVSFLVLFFGTCCCWCAVLGLGNLGEVNSTCLDMVRARLSEVPMDHAGEHVSRSQRIQRQPSLGRLEGRAGQLLEGVRPLDRGGELLQQAGSDGQRLRQSSPLAGFKVGQHREARGREIGPGQRQ